MKYPHVLNFSATECDSNCYKFCANLKSSTRLCGEKPVPVNGHIHVCLQQSKSRESFCFHILLRKRVAAWAESVGTSDCGRLNAMVISMLLNQLKLTGCSFPRSYVVEVQLFQYWLRVCSSYLQIQLKIAWASCQVPFELWQVLACIFRVLK